MRISIDQGDPRAVLNIRGERAVFDRLNGFVLADGGIEGIHDGASWSNAGPDRALQHGAFDAPSYMGPRNITLTGYAIADSPQELEALRWQMSGVLADANLGRITVHNDGLSLWVNCRRDGKTKWRIIGVDRCIAEWQLSLVCKDPRFYGETRFAKEGVPLMNRGNFPAAPETVVEGSAPHGYTLYGPNGRQFVVTAALVPGTPHTVQMGSGYLKWGGALRYGCVSRADIWTVPGGRAITVTSSEGANTTTYVTDTYV